MKYYKARNIYKYISASIILIENISSQVILYLKANILFINIYKNFI